MQRSSTVVLLAATVLVLCNLIGCQRDSGGTNGVLPVGPSAAAPQAPTASVQLSLLLDAPTVAGAVRADVLPASVTVKLTSINIGDTASPTTTQQQTAEVGLDRRATVTFANVPVMPTLAEVTLSNGSVGPYTEFRGAADLVAGPNSITVNGSGSKLLHDVTASVFQRVLESPELRAKVATGFVAAARALVQGLTRTTEQVYDEAAAMVTVGVLQPPPVASAAGFPSLTNASLAGVWFFVELDQRNLTKRGLELTFDGVGQLTCRETIVANGSPAAGLLKTSYQVASDGVVTLGAGQRYANGEMYTDGRRLAYVSYAATDARCGFGIRKRTGVTGTDLAGTWRFQEVGADVNVNVLTIEGTTGTARMTLSSTGDLWNGGNPQIMPGLIVQTDGRLTFGEFSPYEHRFTDGDMLLVFIGGEPDPPDATDTLGMLQIGHRSVTGLTNASVAGNWRCIEFNPKPMSASIGGYTGNNRLLHYTFDGNGGAQVTDVRCSDPAVVLGSRTATYSVATDGGGSGGTNSPAWHTDGRTIIEASTHTTIERYIRFYLRRP